MQEAYNNKYTKEQRRELVRKRAEASAQKFIDSGEAATMEEAVQLNLARAREAFDAKYTGRERQDICIKRGVASAIKYGKYTKYPGVSFREDRQKWRVQFSYKGKKIYVGYYFTEIAAAKAHDAYVRTHKLDRPLHFPNENEQL